MFKFSVKNSKKCLALAEFLEKWFSCKLKRFGMISDFSDYVNSSITGEAEKLDFWDYNSFANFKHQWLQNHKSKVYQPVYH